MSDGAAGGAATVESRHLRSAIEFAVAMGAELARRRASVAPPAAVRSAAGGQRIPTASLGRLRRSIEEAPEFRRAVAAGALPELVDEVGRLWLHGEQGWEVRARAVVDDAAAAEDARRREAQERRAERRRAAESGEITRLRRELEAAQRALAQVRRDRDALTSERDAARRERDALRRQLAGGRRSAPVEDATGDGLGTTGPVERSEARRQRPLRLRGGTGRSDPRSLALLVEAGATVLVDGYNVSMRGWPAVAVGQQRETLVAALDNYVSRTGASVTVVFDGASVEGAHARRRRQVVVTYSSPGVTADDRIVEIVRGEIDATPIAVVTDDGALQRRVRRLGANVLATTALLDSL